MKVDLIYIDKWKELNRHAVLVLSSGTGRRLS